MYAFPRNLTRTLLASCALLTGACDTDYTSESASVEASDETVVTPAQLGLGDDWVSVADGLWTRANDAGEQEYAAIGEAGTPHAIAKLEEVELELESAFTVQPSDENRGHLADLRERITALSLSPLTIDNDEVSFRCYYNSSGTAVAQPIACGVSAAATGNYTNTCNAGITKYISTYALAKCNGETKIHTCDRSGNPVSCLSSVSIAGNPSCYSYASFSVPGATVWKENTTRGACGGTNTTTSTSSPSTSATSASTSNSSGPNNQN